MENRFSKTVLYILMLMLIMVGALSQEVRAAGEDKVKTKSSVFNDIAANEANIVFITYVSQRGIIQGYPDGGFHAQAGLTRAEAAAVLVKAAGLPTPPVTTLAFKDVPVSHWAAAQIAAATKAGYLKGFPDGTYQPEAKVTRAQGIALVMRLCTQKERAVLPSLKDIDSQHWAAGDMATALALEMIGLSKDSQNIYPEAEMSRGSLARALAVLLTKDPGLNAVSLEGTTSEVKGQVTLVRQGKSQELNDKVAILVGDTIKTGGNGSLRLNYPDGSSNLVEANTEINIKQAEGRRYIKGDGSPGIAVDYLNIGMPQGTIFGGVATKHEGQPENSGVNPAAGQTSSRLNRLAARPGFNYLAASDSAQAPWYKTAEQKKVKVKVDMPWGVAAIRGTYLMITVNQDGTCKVSCLTGNVDVSSNRGNQSVAVTGGQTSGITGENSAAQTAAPMSAGEKQDFGNKDVQDWIFNSALQQDVNKEAQVAPPVVQIIVEIPDSKPGEKPQQQVVETTPQETGENKPAENTEVTPAEPPTITAVQTVLDAIKTTGIELKSQALENLKQQLEQMQTQVPQQTVQQLSQQVEQAQSQNNAPANPGNNNATTTTSPGGSSSASSPSSGSGITAMSYSTAGSYGSSDPAVPRTVSSIFVNAENVTLQNMQVLGNVTVNYPNTTLSNLVISGNLYLAAGIGDGNVSLHKVTVNGNTLINGGGANSIEVTDCSLSTVEVDKENNSVRVVAKGSSSIGVLTLNSGAGLAEENLTGTGFSAISINGTDIPATASIVISGSFDGVTINSPNIKLEVPSGSIGELNLGTSASGGNITLAAGARVTRLIANAAGNIAGYGKVEQAEIAAAGVEFLQPPMVWTLSPGVTARIDGETVSQSGANARLASIGLDQGSLNPVFAPKTYSYNVLVGSDIASLTLNPVTEDSQAAFTVSAANLSGTAANPVIALTTGNNTVGIKVTGRDRNSQKDYSLTITRANLPVVSLTNPGAVSVTVYNSVTVNLDPVSPADATITATSSAPGVATVTLSGNNLIINGLTAGSATINVTASKIGYQDTNMSFTAAVNAQPTVALTNPGVQNVTAGQSITVGLSLNPADTTITATSSAPGVATVMVSGNNLVINGLTTGSATIEVSVAKNGYQAASISFTVAVNAQPTVALTNPGTQSVTVGQSITVALSPNPADVTITATSDNSAATVTVGGNNLVINGLTAGSATIEVSASKIGYQSDTMSFTVAVNPQPAVALTNPGTQSVTVGQSITVALSPNPADATITATSDSSAATVTESGGTLTIEGLSPGTVNITVTAQKVGCSDGQISFTVTVNNPTEQRIFSNWNSYGCATGPTSPATFTLTQPFALTFMNTYHHNSPAEAPGTFCLVHSDGTVYGPWNASGGYSSLICYVNFKENGVDEGYQSALGPVTPSSQYPILKPGTYTMIDSHGSTWSYNGNSGYAGFLQVKGYYRTIKPTDDISSSFTDANFKQAVWAWLGNGAGAFSKQDITNAVTTNSGVLSMVECGITSLAGLEHFEGSGLTRLNCCANSITAIPALPSSLTTLICYNNELQRLPAMLPTGLTELNCSGNRLTSLPDLPPSLTNLDCGYNYLDIWTNPVPATITTKTLTPQYRFAYPGSGINLAPLGTYTLSSADLKQQSSSDDTTWADTSYVYNPSDFTFSTNSAWASIDSSGEICTGNGTDNSSIYAKYKNIDSTFTKVNIPLQIGALSSAKAITATSVGLLVNGTIAVPPGTTVVALKAGLTVSAGASAEILQTSGGAAVADQNSTAVTSSMVIRVVAADASQVEYPINYALAKLEDVAAINNNLSGKYLLINDLDFTNSNDYTDAASHQALWSTGTPGWTPLGGFTGVLDGNGHTISHMYINSTSGNLGLFASVSEPGIIRNLGLVNASVTTSSTGTKVGIFAGSNYRSTITNCYATGVLTALGDEVGGIAGNNDDGHIICCNSAVNVSGRSAVGGITGKAGNNGVGPTILNSCSTGNVTGTSSRVGGIIGSAPTIYMDYCYATGRVTGSDQVGGIAGYYESGRIQGSFALNQSITGSSNVGRIAGTALVALTSCYASPNLSTTNNNGTTLSSIANAKNMSTYSGVGWDIANTGTTSVWVIDDGHSLPAIRGQADITGPIILAAVRDSYTQITLTLSERAANATITKTSDGGFSVEKTGDPGTIYSVTTVSPGAADDLAVLTVNNFATAETNGITIKYTTSGNGNVADPNGNLMTTNAVGIGIPSWDATPPTLSGYSASGITSSTATLNFTSDEAGTYYYLVYAAGTSAPDTAAIKAQGTAVAKGTAAAVSGTNSINVSGLTDSTAYKAYMLVRDAAGNDSTMVTVDITTTVAQLGDLALGTIVKDTSSWEHRTGDDYSGTGTVKPVEWIVAAKNHAGYPSNSVTLVAKELISKYTFDNSTTRGSANGSNNWGDSGSSDATRGARTWLNGDFYNNLSTYFKAAILTTTVPNMTYTGTYYESSDKIFIPSWTELGDTANTDTYAVGSKLDYFSNDASRIAPLGGTYPQYWARSPRSGSPSSAMRVSGAGSCVNDCDARWGDEGIRPMLNLNAATYINASNEIIDTSDTTSATLGAITVGSLTNASAALSLSPSEAGTYYYLVYASGDTPPDAATVKAQGTAVAKGSGSAVSGTNNINVSGLAGATAYKAYVVVDDASHNISAVATASFTTCADNYTVSYNGNGNDTGTVPSNGSYVYGGSTTAVGNTGSLAKSGCTFMGWNSAADWTGTDYAAGATINTYAADTVLYAKWRFDTTPTAANLGFKYNNAQLEVTNAALPNYTTLEIFIKGSTPTEQGPGSYEAKYTLDLTNSSNLTIGWHNVGSSPGIYISYYMWYRYINGTAKSNWVQDGQPNGYLPSKGGSQDSDFVAVSSTSITFRNNNTYNGYTLMAIRSGSWVSLGTISSNNQTFTVVAGDQFVIKSPEGNYSYESAPYSY